MILVNAFRRNYANITITLHNTNESCHDLLPHLRANKEEDE